MIIDSTFVIDVLRGSRSVADQLETVDRTGVPFVSSITVMELAEGINRSDASESERAAVEGLLADVNEITFDRASAFRAGELNAELIAAGEPIDETDVMVAATALVHGYPVVTRNTDHFDRIDGLDVLTY